MNSIRPAAAAVIAKFSFRVENEWIGGGHNRTTIKNFYGSQQDHKRKEPFVLDADEPPILLGGDKKVPTRWNTS